MRSLHRKPLFTADLSLLQDLLEKTNADILLMRVWEVNCQVSFLHKIRMRTAAEIRTFKAQLPESPCQFVPGNICKPIQLPQLWLAYLLSAHQWMELPALTSISRLSSLQ